MITKEDVEELGWKDMVSLNPDTRYPVATFGWNVKPAEQEGISGYTADYFLRVDYQEVQDYIEIWRMNPFKPLFSGYVNTKENLKSIMKKLKIC